MSINKNKNKIKFDVNEYGYEGVALEWLMRGKPVVMSAKVFETVKNELLRQRRHHPLCTAELQSAPVDYLFVKFHKDDADPNGFKEIVVDMHGWKLIKDPAWNVWPVLAPMPYDPYGHNNPVHKFPVNGVRARLVFLEQ